MASKFLLGFGDWDGARLGDVGRDGTTLLPPHAPTRAQPHPCSRPWQKLPTWLRPSGHFSVPLEHR